MLNYKFTKPILKFKNIKFFKNIINILKKLQS